MHRLTHHVRGLLVALAALALTAGVAFAARPSVETGLERAAEAAGKTVPPVATEEEPTVPEVDDEVVEEEPPAEEVVEETEPDGEEVIDDEDADDSERPMNHGWYVSEAAKGPTPDGYRNHGAYVSEIARGDDGKPGSDDDAEEDEAGADEESDVTAVKVTGRDRAVEAKARNAERKAERAAGRPGK